MKCSEARRFAYCIVLLEEMEAAQREVKDMAIPDVDDAMKSACDQLRTALRSLNHYYVANLGK